MSKYLIIITLLIVSCSGPSNEGYNTHQTSGNSGEIAAQDSVIMVKLVHEFFDAFDERDLEKMQRLLTPNSKIIHHNGVATNTQEMMEVIQQTNNWYPRKRQLSEFEYIADANLAIVGLKNEVTFFLPEQREVYEPYNETWIFEKLDKSWFPVRIHYSKIIQEEHSEEVE